MMQKKDRKASVSSRFGYIEFFSLLLHQFRYQSRYASPLSLSDAVAIRSTSKLRTPPHILTFFCSLAPGPMDAEWPRWRPQLPRYEAFLCRYSSSLSTAAFPFAPSSMLSSSSSLSTILPFRPPFLFPLTSSSDPSSTSLISVSRSGP